MTSEKLGFNTQLIHAGEARPGPYRSVIQPIFQGATYEFYGGDDPSELRYSRLNNTPNHLCLAQKIAAIEGAEAAVVTSSGMSAITTALLALLEEGEELLAQESLYGGTRRFLRDHFPRLGRQVRFFPADRAGQIESYLSEKTKAIYVESISNPLLRIPNLAAVAKLARAKGLITFIDNTFPSPVNFNPVVLGFDVILHSATKYLNGHTDLIGGCVVGSRRHMDKVTSLLTDLGGSMDPHACFLLTRGLKTLSVRVRQQNETALRLATFLEAHPKVSCVSYPGLSSHPDHAFAREWFRGFGGMLSFEFAGSAEQADRALRRLRIPYVAPSLGGVETLVTRPVTTSHSGFSAEELSRMGISRSLIRVSVGLEEAEDLIADFDHALANVGAE